MSETVMQLDILTEIHEVRRRIHRMKSKERMELMRSAKEITRLLKKGDIEHAKEKITKLTKKNKA